MLNQHFRPFGRCTILCKTLRLRRGFSPSHDSQFNIGVPITLHGYPITFAAINGCCERCCRIALARHDVSGIPGPLSRDQRPYQCIGHLVARAGGILSLKSGISLLNTGIIQLGTQFFEFRWKRVPSESGTLIHSRLWMAWGRRV